MWGRIKRLFGMGPASTPVAPRKPVAAPLAMVWWLAASEIGRTDVAPEYPGLVVDYPPDSDDPRPWQSGTRAQFEAYRARLSRVSRP